MILKERSYDKRRTVEIYIKYNNCALINTIKQIYESIVHQWPEDIRGSNKVFANLQYLEGFVFDVAIFYQFAYEIIHNQVVRSCGRRSVLEPREVYAASSSMLYSANHADNYFVMGSSSIHVLRQALEVRIAGILAVQNIRRIKGGWIDGLFSTLVEFIENNANYIRMPVSGRLIKTVHSWASRFIHTAKCPPLWQSYCANMWIDTLFQPGDNGQTIYYLGAVRMKKEFAERVHDELLSFLKERRGGEYCIEAMDGERPQCLLVDELDESFESFDSVVKRMLENSENSE
jgi:hypothetical protein